MSTRPETRGRLRVRIFEAAAATRAEATEQTSQILDSYQLHNDTAAIEHYTIEHEHERVGPVPKRHSVAITIAYRDPQEDADDDEITSTYYDRNLDELTPSETEELCEIENRQAQRDPSYLRTYYDEIHEHPKAGQR